MTGNQKPVEQWILTFESASGADGPPMVSRILTLLGLASRTCRLRCVAVGGKLGAAEIACDVVQPGLEQEESSPMQIRILQPNIPEEDR